VLKSLALASAHFSAIQFLNPTDKHHPGNDLAHHEARERQHRADSAATRHKPSSGQRTETPGSGAAVQDVQIMSDFLKKQVSQATTSTSLCVRF
jgi:hypothetical protein